MDSARPWTSPPEDFGTVHDDISSLPRSLSTIDIKSIDQDNSPTRQTRLLRPRNARFPKKTLSFSGSLNKITDFAKSKTSKHDSDTSPERNKENILRKSKSIGSLGRRTNLGPLEEISNTARRRASKRRQDVLVYEDNPERPLLDASSPVASPGVPDGAKAVFSSPCPGAQVHDNLDFVQFRELTVQERQSVHLSPPVPASLRIKNTRRRTAPPKSPAFNTEDYIDHIEKELEQVRSQAYSPSSHRPLKEKLQAANRENDRLREELARVQDQFEAEVKRTVEHKTAQEVDLRRRIRDLEGNVAERELRIQQLQYEQERTRLESNTIEDLRSTIERLEQEKLDMKNDHLSMSKRYDVLSQLLAMSPTKPGCPSESNVSPVRERRNGRPMSLILPKLTTSPSKINGLLFSPKPLATAEISPLRLSPASDEEAILSEELGRSYFSPKSTSVANELDERTILPASPPDADVLRRRRTLARESLCSTSGYDISEPIANKRKPRRFVAGSTQLKPLLLPVLTGDEKSIRSISTSSSPGLPATSAISSTYLGSALEPQFGFPFDSDTAFPQEENLADELPSSFLNNIDGPGPACSQSEDEDLEATILSYVEPKGPDMMDIPDDDSPGRFTDLLPVAETPDSVVPIPAPLFSPTRKLGPSIDHLGHHYSDSVGMPLFPELGLVRSQRKRRCSTFSTSNDSPSIKHIRPTLPGTVSANPTCRQIPTTSHRSRPSQADMKRTSVHLGPFKSSDNVIELLRRKNFAVKPLAAVTIRTVYNVLATSSSVIHNLKKDPYDLARRILANAWKMNWKVFGPLSWWVLGLFVQREPERCVEQPLDWAEYDAETFAERHCRSDDHDEQEIGEKLLDSRAEQTGSNRQKCDTQTAEEADKSSWTRSICLWGKFSAALGLAIGSAVVKGPGEMLRDTEQGSDRRSYQSSTRNRTRRTIRQDLAISSPSDESPSPSVVSSEHFDFRSDIQLDSMSLLNDLKENHSHSSTLRPRALSRGRVTGLFNAFEGRSDRSLYYTSP